MFLPTLFLSFMFFLLLIILLQHKKSFSKHKNLCLSICTFYQNYANSMISLKSYSILRPSSHRITERKVSISIYYVYSTWAFSLIISYLVMKSIIQFCVPCLYHHCDVMCEYVSHFARRTIHIAKINTSCHPGQRPDWVDHNQ